MSAIHISLSSTITALDALDKAPIRYNRYDENTNTSIPPNVFLLRYSRKHFYHMDPDRRSYDQHSGDILSFFEGFFSRVSDD